MITSNSAAGTDANSRNRYDGSATVRCRICRRELIAQMTPTGPGFPCDCRDK